MNLKKIVIDALLVGSLGLAGCFGPGGGWGGPVYGGGYPAYAGAPIYERNVYPVHGGWGHPYGYRAGWGGWHGPVAYHHGYAAGFHHGYRGGYHGYHR
jgi:hypothetical protein